MYDTVLEQLWNDDVKGNVPRGPPSVNNIVTLCQ